MTAIILSVISRNQFVIVRPWSPSAPPEAGKLDRTIQCFLDSPIPRSESRAGESGNDVVVDL